MAPNEESADEKPEQVEFAKQVILAELNFAQGKKEDYLRIIEQVAQSPYKTSWVEKSLAKKGPLKILSMVLWTPLRNRLPKTHLRLWSRQYGMQLHYYRLNPAASAVLPTRCR